MELNIHFHKHGRKFGIGTVAEYERMADAFMFGQMNADTRQCTRPSGKDRLRHNFANRYFGVACVNPAFVRTFYPVENYIIASHGGQQQFFAFECGRRIL